MIEMGERQAFVEAIEELRLVAHANRVGMLYLMQSLKRMSPELATEMRDRINVIGDRLLEDGDRAMADALYKLNEEGFPL